MARLVDKLCATCGRAFRIRVALVKQKHCSRLCSGEARRVDVKPVRVLRYGDEVPDQKPRRYIDSHGYVILRWTLGPGEVVEAKEHRVVMGLPPDHMPVHHINGIKTDNRPENLCVLESQSQHQAMHVSPSWDVSAAMEEYRAGASYPDLSRKYGVHQVTILRAFRVRGFASRPAPGRYECVATEKRIGHSEPRR